MGLGGKRDKEKQTEGREVSLCAEVCLQGWVWWVGQGTPVLPPPPQPAPHSFTNSRPQAGAGCRAGRQCAEPPCLFKPPRASSKFSILVRSSLFFQHHKLLLIIHHDLMDHPRICSLLHTKTSLCSVWLCYKQAPHKPLPVVFKQRNIIFFLKYTGVFFIHLKFLYEDWYLNSLKFN